MGENPHGFLVVIEYDVIEYGVVVRGDFPPGKIHIHVGILYIQCIRRHTQS